MDAPGLTTPILSRFAWQHLPRPVIPLDRDVELDAPMTLADLPTPCLVLDRGVLARNIGRMAPGRGIASRAWCCGRT